MLKIKAALCALFLVAGGAAAQEGRRVNQFEVYGWRGAAFVNEIRKEFRHCYIEADYIVNDTTDVTVGFTIRKDNKFVVSLTSPSWRLSRNEIFPIDFSLTRAGSVNLDAEAITTNTLIFYLNSTQSNYNLIRKAAAMTVRFKGDKYVLNLTRTNESVPALLRCVDQALWEYPGPGEGDPGPRRVEAMEVMTSFFTMTEKKFQIIADPQKRKYYGEPDVLWRMDNFMGSTQIYLTEEREESTDFVTRELSYDYTSACLYKSSKREEKENIFGRFVITTLMKCTDRDNVKFLVNLTVVPRRLGGYYVIKTSITFEDDRDTSDLFDETFRKEVVRFLMER